MLGSDTWYRPPFGGNIPNWIYPLIHKDIVPGQGDWYSLTSPAMKMLSALKMYFRLPGTKLKFSISSLFVVKQAAMWTLTRYSQSDASNYIISDNFSNISDAWVPIIRSPHWVRQYWCCKATRHYLGQCWHKVMPTGVNVINDRACYFNRSRHLR